MKELIGVVAGLGGIVVFIIWMNTDGNTALFWIGTMLIVVAYYLLGLHKVFGKKKGQTADPRMVAHMSRTAPGLYKAFGESVNLVDTTVKPDVFFGRYDFMLQTLQRLVEAEKYLKKSEGKSSVMLEELSKPQTREDQINNFIKRSHERMLQDISALKTDKGRANKANRYFEEMKQYHEKVYPPNIELLEQLRDADN